MYHEDEKPNPVIKVIGVGSGGIHALSSMARTDIDGVQFIAVDTDRKALEHVQAQEKLLIGSRLTGGSGAGGNPETGRGAALENAEKIMTMIVDADILFIVAGMGGGTGTGAAPVIAKIARGAGATVVVVVNRPFSFEGLHRMDKADEGIAELKKIADAHIIIQGDRLFHPTEKRKSESFNLLDEALYQAVKGITDIIMGAPGFINLDFSDVKRMLSNHGRVLVGFGIGQGEGRSIQAAKNAVSSPLLGDKSIRDARRILINITGGADMGINELDDASAVIRAENTNADILFGARINNTGEMTVTVIAAGFNDDISPPPRCPVIRFPVAKFEE